MLDYIKLLEEYKIWPIENWNHFEFLHHKPDNKDDEKKQVNFLRDKVLNYNGLYVYQKKGEWIYVGKGAPLFYRLKSHYHESFRKVSGDTNDHKWHRFFSENSGSLNIYWKEITNETDRQIFELSLKTIINPTFEKFH
jgi:excinuclease UvrABC nuclease subunit